MIKIFVIDKCKYCDKLKSLLEGENIPFQIMNISQDDNHKFYEKLCEISKADSVPLITVGKHILAPNVSFNTIDQAFEIIKQLIQ